VQAFVDLQRRNAEIARQAALLRTHERREHELSLTEERRRWEEEALRKRMEEQQQVNAELRRHADELALTVAERERVERELTRTNARLAEADRRKDDFLAILSHELRTPLACLVTSLENLRRFAPERESQVQFSRARDTMNRQVSHLVRLVDDLLDISRIQSDSIRLQKERVEVIEIVGRAQSIGHPEISHRGHRLGISMPKEPIWLQVDAVRLTQVIANLLINAARYTPPGGQIDLKVTREGSEAVIEVTDSGVGIPPDRLPDVFDMFVRHAPGDGLGLGLSLARRLVEMHGGSISARSEGAGRGSCFTVRIAVASPTDDPVRERSDSIDDIEAWIARRPQLRVVLIEDDPDIGAALRDLLESWDHRVDIATSGRGGLELLADIRPDVAIVDIGLPDIDGYEVARQAKQAWPSLRLVAMSGYGRPEDHERALAVGFDELLVKPATSLQLARALFSAHPSDVSATHHGDQNASIVHDS
jgi:signal transduction histidine kinase/CheY-like chemotaxis protein